MKEFAGKVAGITGTLVNIPPQDWEWITSVNFLLYVDRWVFYWAVDFSAIDSAEAFGLGCQCGRSSPGGVLCGDNFGFHALFRCDSNVAAYVSYDSQGDL